MNLQLNFSRLILMILLLTGIFFSCRKAEDIEEPVEPPVTDTTSMNADTISNHLIFTNAKKISGTIPNGPASNSLKISVKDTIYLTDLMGPIKFLHEDTTKNVAGMYVQVQTIIASTFYYDVPEVADVAPNDTVTLIMMGMEPLGSDEDGVPPAGGVPFEVTIVPYDKNGQPIGEETIPVVVVAPQVDINGPCGLITRPGDYWDWEVSYILDPQIPVGKEFSFLNEPNKLWGLNGQDIKGCCINGVSSYDIICSSDTAHHKTLRFFTFFNWPEETYKFFEGGTYAGQSDFFDAVPDPQGSNFCGSGPGKVEEDFDRNLLEGNWTVQQLANPVDGDSLFLSLQGTSGGGSTARPNGRIRILSCSLLVVIQPDNEGGANELVKFYNRQGPGSPYWNPFN